jgi:uncharacterized SAM-binding protein YcdF (DUF218 family)
MAFILSKILAFVIQPLVWIITLYFISFFIKNKIYKKRLLITTFIIFLFFSNTFIVAKIYNWYEVYLPKNEQNFDVGILLGGFTKSTKTGKLEVNERGDRLVQTIALYKKGIIKKIMISGGSGKLFGEENLEADLTYSYLKEIGVADSAIIRENKSRNTIENAKYSLEILNKINPQAKILVISSAWHLPRVEMIFNKIAKRKLNYYPTDFLGKTDFDTSDFILPDPVAFRNWNYILKEWIGLVVDKIRI